MIQDKELYAKAEKIIECIDVSINLNQMKFYTSMIMNSALSSIRISKRVYKEFEEKQAFQYRISALEDLSTLQIVNLRSLSIKF